MNSAQQTRTKVCPRCQYLNSRLKQFCQGCNAPLDPKIYAKLRQKHDAVSTQNRVQERKKKQETTWPSFLSYKTLFYALVSSLTLVAAYKIWLPFEIKIESKKQIQQTQNVPEGLYFYGGNGFSALMSKGLADKVSLAFPDFQVRFSTPTDRDYSSSSAIKRLLREELDFVFSNRPLKTAEHTEAVLRGIKLQQQALALDGIVVYANLDKPIPLKLNQLEDILAEKITNWKQLGGKNLPITPVLLTGENLETLGIDVNANNLNPQTIYQANTTLAFREVISTPGAISYSSASLVRGQSLITPIPLAPKHSSNYVTPFVDGQLNLKAFTDGSYPLVQRLYLVFNSRARSIASGSAYATFLSSDEGQNLIEDSGFVPINK